MLLGAISTFSPLQGAERGSSWSGTSPNKASSAHKYYNHALNSPTVSKKLSRWESGSSSSSFHASPNYLLPSLSVPSSSMPVQPYMSSQSRPEIPTRSSAESDRSRFSRTGRRKSKLWPRTALAATKYGKL